MYGKHFSSMYTGSMHGAGAHVFAVWGWIIANTDRDATVEINPNYVGPILGCAADAVESALRFLLAPDERSRNRSNEGRRLLHLGAYLYQVVSFHKYRKLTSTDDRRRYMKDYMRRYRAKEKLGVNKRKRPLAKVAEAEAEAEADTDKKNIPAASPRDVLAEAAPANGKPPSAFTELRDHYVNSWQRKYGRPYPFRKVDGVKLAELLKLSGGALEDAKATIDRYLADEGIFFNGHSLSLLTSASQFPKFFVDADAAIKQQARRIVEGMNR